MNMSPSIVDATVTGSRAMRSEVRTFQTKSYIRPPEFLTVSDDGSNRWVIYCNIATNRADTYMTESDPDIPIFPSEDILDGRAWGIFPFGALSVITGLLKTSTETEQFKVEPLDPGLKRYQFIGMKLNYDAGPVREGQILYDIQVEPISGRIVKVIGGFLYDKTLWHIRDVMRVHYGMGAQKDIPTLIQSSVDISQDFSVNDYRDWTWTATDVQPLPSSFDFAAKIKELREGMHRGDLNYKKGYADYKRSGGVSTKTFAIGAILILLAIVIFWRHSSKA